jgi:hypothetical protein
MDVILQGDLVGLISGNSVKPISHWGFGFAFGINGLAGGVVRQAGHGMIL